MTAGRVAAIVVAAAMIVGAWFVRDRVLDDDTGTDATTAAVVCVNDLAAICQAVENALGVDIRVESVDDTLTAWGSNDETPNEVWITMAPFPEMADTLRTNDRLAPTGAAVEVVASSPLTLVTNADVADDITTMCGDPVDWSCLGSDPPGVKVGFAPFPHTAIGQLGVTSAVVGFGAGSVPTSGDTSFTLWARQIADDSNNRVGVATSVASIQTRPSLFDVAVGAEAELVDPADPRFVLLAPSDPSNVDVVVATPDGASAPGGLVDALRDELTATGWDSPRNAGTTVSPGAMLAVREIWKDYL